MKIRQKVASFFYSIGNSFEGAMRSSARGNPNAQNPTDAKAELPSYTRTELVRKSRYLEKNSGHIRGVLRDLKVYGIGKGIYPNVKSDSHAWNRKSADYFYRWARHCDITNRFSWKECQAMILRALIVDGEIFVIKTFDNFKRPKIQIIESHRLVSPSSSTNNYVVDGIEFDKVGRVKAYHFLIGESGNVRRIPSNAVIHIFDAERVSQARAYPQIQHTINDVIDRKEILALEKKKVKTISDIVHIIKGGNVSLDGDYKVDVGNTSEGTSVETMNKIIGGKNLRVQTDESVDVSSIVTLETQAKQEITWVDSNTGTGYKANALVWDVQTPNVKDIDWRTMELIGADGKSYNVKILTFITEADNQTSTGKTEPTDVDFIGADGKSYKAKFVRVVTEGESFDPTGKAVPVEVEVCEDGDLKSKTFVEITN